jgi:hypothetical protein
MVAYPRLALKLPKIGTSQFVPRLALSGITKAKR